MGVYFEDVSVGDPLPELVRGPMRSTHLMRWSSAVENWHRIHYDQPFAVEHDNLPGLLINGSWKQHMLVQFLRGWSGHTGWLWKVSYRFRRMDVVGDTLTAFGEVTELEKADGFGLVTATVGIRNSRGEVSTEGGAVVA